MSQRASRDKSLLISRMAWEAMLWLFPHLYRITFALSFIVSESYLKVRVVYQYSWIRKLMTKECKGPEYERLSKLLSRFHSTGSAKLLYSWKDFSMYYVIVRQQTNKNNTNCYYFFKVGKPVFVIIVTGISKSKMS